MKSLQVVEAELAGEVGRQRLAGGALAQHAVAAGAALEVDLLGFFEFRLAELRHAGLRPGLLGGDVRQDIVFRLVLVARLGPVDILRLYLLSRIRALYRLIDRVLSVLLLLRHEAGRPEYN